MEEGKESKVTPDSNERSELERRATHQQNTDLKENTSGNSEYQEITKTSQLETPVNEQQTNRGKRDVGIKGGYDYKLEGEAQLPVEGVEECPICHLIPHKPAKVGCCGYIFCLSCIETHYNEDKHCPLCRSEEDFKWMIDKLQERKIMELKVLCVNHKQGCDWKGELKNAENHSKKDPYEVSDGVRGCKYQLTTCKKCDEEIMYIKLNNHLKNTCKHRDKDCPFKFAGCNFCGPESGMSKHVHQNTADHLTLVAHFVKKDKDEVKNKKCLKCLKWFCISLFVVILIVLVLIFLGISQSRQHDIEKSITELNNYIQEVSETIDSEVKRKLNSNELAIQSLHYDIEQDVKVQILTLQQTLKKLQEEIGQLKIDVGDLNSGFTKLVDDWIKKTLSFLHYPGLE